jgi:hypothetical protein
VSDIVTLRRILAESRTIAVVGLSADWYRPSYFAAKYMQEHGYRIVPVNPQYTEILGETLLPHAVGHPVQGRHRRRASRRPPTSCRSPRKRSRSAPSACGSRLA